MASLATPSNLSLKRNSLQCKPLRPRRLKLSQASTYQGQNAVFSRKLGLQHNQLHLPQLSGTGSTAVSSQLANDLDTLGSSILAPSRRTRMATMSWKRLAKIRQSLYHGPTRLFTSSPVTQIGHKSQPAWTKLFGVHSCYFSIFDGLLQSGEHVQAQQLCLYMKFLSKKEIVFSTMMHFGTWSYVARLLMTIIPCLKICRPTILTLRQWKHLTLGPRLPHPGNPQAGSPKSFGKHCCSMVLI